MIRDGTLVNTNLLSYVNSGAQLTAAANGLSANSNFVVTIFAGAEQVGANITVLTAPSRTRLADYFYLQSQKIHLF